MTKEQKEKLKRELKTALPATAVLSAEPIINRAIKSVIDRPVGKSLDKTLADRLIESARSRGIEVRRGAQNMGKSYVFPKDTNERIRKALSEGAKIRLDTPEGMVPIQELMGRKIVWLRQGKDAGPAMIAHELGHIKNVRRPNTQILTTGVPLASKVVGPLAGIIGARAAKTEEGARRAGTIGALISLIGSTPALLHEGAASVRGMKLMRQQGATRGQVARLGVGKLLPQFGTYALMAGAPALASYLIGRAIAQYKRKDKNK